MRVLLDENLDHALRTLLGPHEIVTVTYMGWAGLKNGELLLVAEDSTIDILLTGDQTLIHEQNLSGHRLAIVALSAIRLPKKDFPVSGFYVWVAGCRRARGA